MRGCGVLPRWRGAVALLRVAAAAAEYKTVDSGGSCDSHGYKVIGTSTGTPDDIAKCKLAWDQLGIGGNNGPQGALPQPGPDPTKENSEDPHCWPDVGDPQDVCKTCSCGPPDTCGAGAGGGARCFFEDAPAGCYRDDTPGQRLWYNVGTRNLNQCGGGYVCICETRPPTAAPAAPTTPPSDYPIGQPSRSPSGPTLSPASPTSPPSGSPSPEPPPSASPSVAPVVAPSTAPASPTAVPSVAPSVPPTAPPVAAPPPSAVPTVSPVLRRPPTLAPSQPPSRPPAGPSGAPTAQVPVPTSAPTAGPTSAPSPAPSLSPAAPPSAPPSRPPAPPAAPTAVPAAPNSPSAAPSAQPSARPATPGTPTASPLVPPTAAPGTRDPSLGPSQAPPPSAAPSPPPSLSPSPPPSLSPLTPGTPTKAPLPPSAAPSAARPPSSAPSDAPATPPSTPAPGTPAPATPAPGGARVSWHTASVTVESTDVSEKGVLIHVHLDAGLFDRSTWGKRTAPVDVTTDRKPGGPPRLGVAWAKATKNSLLQVVDNGMNDTDATIMFGPIEGYLADASEHVYFTLLSKGVVGPLNNETSAVLRIKVKKTEALGEEQAKAAATAAAVTSVVATGAAGPAQNLAMLLGMECPNSGNDGEEDDGEEEEEVPRTSHPFGFKIGGSLCAGAFVGNLALVVGCFTLLHYVGAYTARCILNAWTPPQPFPQFWKNPGKAWGIRHVQGLVRFPAIPIFLYVFCYQGNAQCAWKQLFKGESPVLVFASLVVIALLLAGPLILARRLYRAVPNLMHFRTDPQPESKFWRFVAGPGEWLSQDRDNPVSWRYALQLWPFTNKCCWFLGVDFLYQFATGLAAAIPTDGYAACGHVNVFVALVTFGCLGVEVHFRPHSKPRDNIADIARLGLISIATLLKAFKYYLISGGSSGETLGGLSSALLFVATAVILIKVAFDLLATLWGLKTSRRNRMQAEFWTQLMRQATEEAAALNRRDLRRQGTGSDDGSEDVSWQNILRDAGKDEPNCLEVPYRLERPNISSMQSLDSVMTHVSVEYRDMAEPRQDTGVRPCPGVFGGSMTHGTLVTLMGEDRRGSSSAIDPLETTHTSSAGSAAPTPVAVTRAQTQRIAGGGRGTGRRRRPGGAGDARKNPASPQQLRSPPMHVKSIRATASATDAELQEVLSPVQLPDTFGTVSDSFADGRRASMATATPRRFPASGLSPSSSSFAMHGTPAPKRRMQSVRCIVPQSEEITPEEESPRNRSLARESNTDSPTHRAGVRRLPSLSRPPAPLAQSMPLRTQSPATSSAGGGAAARVRTEGAPGRLSDAHRASANRLRASPRRPGKSASPTFSPVTEMDQSV
eukprot:TRINITY_DN25322_c0_g1_i2.p1 TRINITY_DN25322_c0_g1~~TRINITY_DN25322_c0_g1_i2.p1  ORF type:complete len:1350 (+),score=263.08 TRINITY_DN25322_c0_g1_i2:131-4180(+)